MLRDNFSNCYFEHFAKFRDPKNEVLQNAKPFLFQNLHWKPKNYVPLSLSSRSTQVFRRREACNLHGHTRTHKIICSHTYLHTCIHAYVHINIYTHTRTHSPNSSVASRYLCFVAFFAEEEGLVVWGTPCAPPSVLSFIHVPILNTSPFSISRIHSSTLFGYQNSEFVAWLVCKGLKQEPSLRQTWASEVVFLFEGGVPPWFSTATVDVLGYLDLCYTAMRTPPPLLATPPPMLVNPHHFCNACIQPCTSRTAATARWNGNMLAFAYTENLLAKIHEICDLLVKFIANLFLFFSFFLSRKCSHFHPLKTLPKILKTIQTICKTIKEDILNENRPTAQRPRRGF